MATALSTEYASGMSTDAIARLRKTGEKLPPKLREEILELGRAAVPDLVAVLEDGDWAAIHAVDLLVDLQATEAIPALLDAVADSEWDDILSNRVVVRLPELGAAVMEPALALLPDAEEDLAPALCEMLANIGVKDERIFEALTERFQSEREDFWAALLATYGDQRALPLIEDALADFEPDFSDMMSRVELRELLDAHERLGGALPAERREEIAGWLDEWNARFSPARAQNRKVGRNDPCPCGSGKKYKKCCIDARERSPAPAIITRDGDRLLTSGGVSAEQLALARGFYAEKDAGRGPAQQMVDYARPIIDSSDGSHEATQSALTMAMLFWNIAVMPQEFMRRSALDEMAQRLAPADRGEFERTAHMMLERHRTMFPEMHRRAV